MEALKTENPV